MFKNRALVWAKVETNYGVDSTPTKTANAILCDLPEIEFVFKKMDRLNVKTFLGNRANINIGEALKITFNTEIKGCGDATPSIPPEIGVLFVGCGCDEDISTNVSYTYHPQDLLDGPSITIYFYQHDLLHVLAGCRGTFSVDGTAGEYGKIKWEFTGLYAGPSDSTAPTDSTYNATLPPALKSGAFLLGAFAGTIGTFKMAIGNEIAKRPDVNASTGFLAHFIKERKATAEIDPEAPALSSWNPVSILTAGTPASLAIQFGTAAGNRMKITAANVILDGVKYAEREGILTYAVPLLLCPTVGEDDFNIVFD